MRQVTTSTTPSDKVKSPAHSVPVCARQDEAIRRRSTGSYLPHPTCCTLTRKFPTARLSSPRRPAERELQQIENGQAVYWRTNASTATASGTRIESLSRKGALASRVRACE